MPRKIAPIPRGFRTATPCLVVNGVDQAIEFYSVALGATVEKQIRDIADTCTVHAVIKIGNSMLILQQESSEMGLYSPVTLGGAGCQTHLYIEDIDTFWNAAIQAGAVAISEPVDVYWGERTAMLMDPYGHHWSLATRIEQLSKVEIQERASALYFPDLEEGVALATEVVA